MKLQRTLPLLFLGLGLGSAAPSGAATVLDSGPFGIGQDEAVRLLIKSAPPDEGPTGANLACKARFAVPAATGAGSAKPKPLSFVLRPGQIQTADIAPDVVFATGQATMASKLPPRWYTGGRLIVESGNPTPDQAGDLLCGKLVSARMEVISRTTGEVLATHDLTQAF